MSQTRHKRPPSDVVGASARRRQHDNGSPRRSSHLSGARPELWPAGRLDGQKRQVSRLGRRQTRREPPGPSAGARPMPITQQAAGQTRTRARRLDGIGPGPRRQTNNYPSAHVYLAPAPGLVLDPALVAPAGVPAPARTMTNSRMIIAFGPAPGGQVARQPVACCLHIISLFVRRE